MGFIVETPPSPHIAGRATRLIARDFFLLVMASRASTRRARRQSSSLLPSSKHSHLEQGRTDLFRACSLTVRCDCLFPSNKDGPSRTGAIPSALLPAQSKSAVWLSLFRGTFVSTSKKSKPLKQARPEPCPACSVKIHSVIVLTNRTTFIHWH